jgi:hypothetical protein
MDEHISSKKALEDLSVIKETIDRTTGASIFTNFIFSTGTLLALGGVGVIIGCIINFYIISKYGFSPEIKKVMIIMWAVLLFLIALINIIFFARQAKQHGMDLGAYYLQIANKTFLQIDIPLEIMCVFFMVFFLKIGQPFYMLPTIAMWLAVLLTSLGTVYVERSFQYAGYIYLISGGGGLLFCHNFALPYTALVFGVLSVILGLLMHGRYRHLREEHLQEQQTGNNDAVTVNDKE